MKRGMQCICVFLGSIERKKPIKRHLGGKVCTFVIHVIIVPYFSFLYNAGFILKR